MNFVNEKVEHINFGFGVITEVKDHRIYVQFQNNEIGDKVFQYPDAFEKFLKAENPKVKSNVQKELHAKQNHIVLERERKVAEFKEKIITIVSEKKKTTSKSRKKSERS